MACAQSVHKLNDILEEYRSKKCVFLVGIRPEIVHHSVYRVVHCMCSQYSSLIFTIHSYTQEFPKRFQKDIVKAAAVNSRRHYVQAVSADGIENVLNNIGMGDRMSRSEIEGIISEVGAGDEMSAEQMLDLMSKNWEDHHQARFD